MTPVNDTTAQIILTEYRANYLKYNARCSSEQLAVFSEIFYDKGWQAYIDGKPVDHIRANYVLRAMRIPAGEHTIEYKFHPRSYYVSDKIRLPVQSFSYCCLPELGWSGGKKLEDSRGRLKILKTACSQVLS